MRLPQFVLVVIVSFAVAFVTGKYIFPVKGDAAQTAAESAYDRVMRTGVLRCGYQYWDSAVMRDEKNGRLYGAWVDIMNAVGEATGLNIEWVAQVGWDEVGAALKTHKIDAMCAGMWTSAAKSKEIAFTTPMAYQAIEAFVRADDHRFDGGEGRLNSASAKISIIDNDNSDFIARQDFPNAQRVSLGQMNGTDGDLLMYVMSGKSDATFTVAGLWKQFDKANHGKVRRLAPDAKLRVFGLALAVDNGEPRLLQVLNAGEQEIQNSGKLDKILDNANQSWPDMFIKPLKPFP